MATIIDTSGGGNISGEARRVSNAAVNAGDPLLADSDGKVGPCGDDASGIYGWALNTVDATGKDVYPIPATGTKRWILPIKSAVYAVQAAGAIAPTPGTTALAAQGTTLLSHIGTAVGLDLTAGVYSADLGTAGNGLLSVKGFRYNWSTAKWEAVCGIVPSKSQADEYAV